MTFVRAQITRCGSELGRVRARGERDEGLVEETGRRSGWDRKVYAAAVRVLYCSQSQTCLFGQKPQNHPTKRKGFRDDM